MFLFVRFPPGVGCELAGAELPPEPLLPAGRRDGSGQDGASGHVSALLGQPAADARPVPGGGAAVHHAALETRNRAIHRHIHIFK